MKIVKSNFWYNLFIFGDLGSKLFGILDIMSFYIIDVLDFKIWPYLDNNGGSDW